ncbi:MULTISPECIES: TIGR04255 family protein [unclassified Methylobacterium]|uniref:TIGR04255 family protein n=1 Tax=unclassified Methylobacterium TaxID=2615210 RepID=UPI0011C1FA1B|nr:MULTISPECIES: TIGR04255 family protein [unclassified Methylobacterium]QEE40708.1 TIGR04255 family protein [Methylobacterium sp. WL1]TXN55840.1 TIGR04255 family protein [Methylobacterium sp. WL2]
MSATMRFDPIYPAHAIERCSATLIFGDPITEKLLLKMRAKANAVFSSLQMVVQSHPQMGFEINPQTGIATPKQMGVGSLVYSNTDRTLSCVITPGALIWNNLRYARWQPFIGQMEQVVSQLLPIVSDAVDVVSVKLEYLDRFYWSGDWDSFSIGKLLRSDKGMWAEAAIKAKREWHSHVGWFDYASANERTLINVNIDVVSAARPGEENAVPSVGILTLLQDQIFTAVDGAQAPEQAGYTDPISHLDKQHLVLKDILAEVILPEMADRITLNPPSR